MTNLSRDRDREANARYAAISAFAGNGSAFGDDDAE